MQCMMLLPNPYADVSYKKFYTLCKGFTMSLLLYSSCAVLAKALSAQPVSQPSIRRIRVTFLRHI
jgi:hypothetical protein